MSIDSGAISPVATVYVASVAGACFLLSDQSRVGVAGLVIASSVASVVGTVDCNCDKRNATPAVASWPPRVAAMPDSVRTLADSGTIAACDPAEILPEPQP